MTLKIPEKPTEEQNLLYYADPLFYNTPQNKYRVIFFRNKECGKNYSWTLYKYTNMRFGLLFILLICSNILMIGQEQLGLRNENYSGVNSIFLNPALTSTSPLKWDVNLFSAGFFMDNNYAYFEDASVFALYRKRNDLDLVYAQDSIPRNQIPASSFYLDYVNDGRKRFVSTLVTVNGPSGMVKIDNHTVGLFYNYRFAFGSLNVPTNFSYYPYINQKFYDSFYVAPFEGSMMVWDEIGINYGYKFETQSGFLAVSTNLKLIGGKEAAFLGNKRGLDYTKLPNDSIMSNQAELEYGLTTASLKKGEYARENLGRGFGIDIGVVATFGGYKDEGYDLKLGVSVLDLGYVNFTKDTELHYASTGNLVEVAADDYDILTMDTDRYADYLRTFSQQALGDSLASLVGTSFKMALPTGVSLQADYSFTEFAFLNFTFVQGIPTGDHYVIRNSLLAVTPRYEHPWVTVQLPLVWYNYQDFRVGLAGRVAFFTLGTDNLLSLFGRSSNLSGTDIYFGIKLNPFTRKQGDRYSGPGRSRIGKKRAKCYDF